MAERTITCIGGTVAALVAADALRRAGHDVELLLPARGVGGSFAPPVRAGCRLDLGVRLLELGSDDAAGPDAPLSAYRPGYGAHRPYTQLVARYLEDLCGDDLAEVPAPELHVAGAWHRDVLFTVDLRGLRDLVPAALLPAAIAEVAVARERLGDAGVLALPPAALEAMTLEEASRANHGDTLHELLIGPLCDKICAGGGEAALARYARKLWMPLFWPRTLAEALAGERPAFCPDRRFHTVREGGTGQVIDRLVERAPGRVVGRLVAASPDTLVFEDGTRVPTAGAVLGVPAEEAFAAVDGAEQLDRATSALAWLDVADDELAHVPSMAHVADPDEDAFRVSCNGHQPAAGRTVLVVELRHDAPADIAAAAWASLTRTGVLRDGARPRVLGAFNGPSFPLPNAANAARFERCAEVLRERLPDIHLVGPATAFGADSLNEQVVQGLHAAEALA